MSRFWIAVASREHVMRGVAGGFAQICHGKPGPLKRMAVNDWIIYYSPTDKFNGKELCRKFTAIGRINDNKLYEFQMNKDFVPWRRNIAFLPAKEVDIKPLIDRLCFIYDKQRWGFPFRRGCFEITEKDFHLIANAMGINIDD